MAKSLLKKGNLKLHSIEDIDIEFITEKLYEFVNEYRKSNKLSSCIFTLPAIKLEEFDQGEKLFWSVLRKVQEFDKLRYRHDPRVSSDPSDPQYSFSVKEEAMFVLFLHPKSPRKARRFKSPALVFNPHQQFETLRKKNIFFKIRDAIRKRDLALQGESNEMLSDFGSRSEIFQYSGRKYGESERIEL